MTIASGSQSQVNSTTTGNQTAPQTIALADGTYVVVWDTPSGWSLQRFAANASAMGGEIAYTTETFSLMPTTWAALPDGRLAYAFTRELVPTLSYMYFGILDGDGSVSLPMRKIEGFYLTTPTGLELAVNAGGDIFLVGSDDHAVLGIQLSPDDGQAIGGGSVAYHGDAGHDGHKASNVRVVVAPDGDFLAIYDREEEGGEARYFDPDAEGANHFGPRFSVPVPPSARVVHGDGKLYFAWIEEDENDNPNVAVGSTNGTSVDAFWADSLGTDPSDVNLWQLADGRLLVTWTASAGGDGDGKSVMGQLVAEGVPIGGAFVINSSTAGDQSDVSIAALDDGRFVATWQTPDSDGIGIASRTFDPKSLTGTDDPDLLIGGAFDDTIVAGAGDDILDGEAGDDSIDAEAGEDIVYGSAGDDTIDGGGDDDVYLVGGTWADWIIEQDDNGNVLVQWHDDPDYGTKTLSNIESIRFGDNSEMALDSIPDNSPPAAIVDSNSSDAVIEATDPTAQGNVLANDTDANLTLGDRLSVVSGRFGSNAAVVVDADGATIAGTYGTLTLSADGTYLYTLNDSPAVRALRTGDLRTEVFTYTMSDVRGETSSSTLSITLSGKNSGPIVAADAFATIEDTPKVIMVASLLANDSHPEGRSFQFIAAQGADNGSVAMSGSTVVFTPDSDYAGAASFAYTIEDDAGLRTTGTVNLTIAAAPDAPRTAVDTLRAQQGVATTYSAAQLLANDYDPDGDTLTLIGVTSNTGGTAVLNGNGTVTFTSTATAHGNGPSFNYTVSDGHGGTATGTANVFVEAPNRAPVANDDSYSTTGPVFSISEAALLANDTDADGDVLMLAKPPGQFSMVTFSKVVGGTAHYIDGNVHFFATSGFTGVASFTYQATDGIATSNEATVRINVSPLVTIPLEPPGPFEPPVIPLLPVSGTSQSDLIERTSHAEDIRGRGGHDTIKAAGGDDRLRGESGNDKLYGGSGRDTLVGGAGKDSLSGGSHADAFVFNLKPSTSNVDTISDFKHNTDVIQLENSVFKTIGPTLEAGEFFAKRGAIKAHDADDRIVYDKSTGKLYYDDDGKGGHAAVHFATLSNKPTLDHGDFAIV